LLRDYEILYIVRPDLDEEHVSEAVATVTKLIENLGGSHQKTDVWGRRRLAYEVRHLREGHYVLTDFQIEPERVAEMEATLKISDTVFRHLIVRKPEPSKKNGAAARRRAGSGRSGR
jgi:small subunit ribosomal protein S6